MSSRTTVVPSYRHHKGTNQAFVQFKGKRHYLGRHGTAESKQRYARFIAELGANPNVVTPIPTAPPNEITVVELGKRAPICERAVHLNRKPQRNPRFP